MIIGQLGIKNPTVVGRKTQKSRQLSPFYEGKTGISLKGFKGFKLYLKKDKDI